MKFIRIGFLTVCFSVLVFGQAVQNPIIGETEKVFSLAEGNDEVRGLAWDEVSGDAPRLLVLDASRKIFVYASITSPQGEMEDLKLAKVLELPTTEKGRPLADPRGLAYSQERGKGIVYFLNWARMEGGPVSELWRYGLEDGSISVINLSLYPFRIGDREVLDVGYDDGKILVGFDASGYRDQNLRALRGIIRLEWNLAYDGKLEFIKHLPDSGIEPSRGLAFMNFEGAKYLWSTVGEKYIYCADAETGRGIFHFARPRSAAGEEASPVGLAFGQQALWVPEGASGPDRVLRVNVTKNLDAAAVGPRILRHLIMSISTEPEGAVAQAGKVYHYYSRPYAANQMPNQGTWPETETFKDSSEPATGQLKKPTYDPAGDVSSRQHMALVEYPDGPARSYSSQYEIDFWTNPYRKFVYPHRVNRDTQLLKGSDYLADDPVLFNLSDTKTYDAFFKKVREHIAAKYGVPADMDNPYWAARNIVEFIQDSYYYPSRPKRKPAAVDYDRDHTDANPGNLKIELSLKPYDKNQIIACSGTSVMVAGAMRYLGMEARWLGTGTENSPKEWDSNGNGLLEEGETAPCSNGHRYTQVWLGSHYGWICFDATPTRPDDDDFDPPPPLQTQWRYMNRTAAGHLKDKRIVFNVGSAVFMPLFRDFEYDEDLAVDNDCGGDQRYNLQGRFDKPELWELAKHRISVTNLCFIKNVAVSGPPQASRVSWACSGQWDRDPRATLSIVLQKADPKTKKTEDVALLLQGISYKTGQTQVDLSSYSGPSFRILIRKDGDPETGGHSEWFDLR
ncbi:MAG: hypothetical protein OEW18_11490 [Candidatus Aminicenantes bacterium]|nr:hypothetical protein [Candidatus Aminicenantes bacterium]